MMAITMMIAGPGRNFRKKTYLVTVSRSQFVRLFRAVVVVVFSWIEFFTSHYSRSVRLECYD
jgi:hypothetical protein